MNYLLLFITVLMWSFVGVMVKAAAGMVDTSTITLCRFLFGFVSLGIFLLVKEKRIHLHWKNKWIWVGVLGKSCNYIFENIAISMGFAYGNVIVLPVQTIFLAFIAVVFFKEKTDWLKTTAVALCVAGVLLVSWKGAPLSELLGQNMLPNILFVVAAIGAGIHIMSQKRLIESMDSGNMNFSVFFFSAVITAVPVPFTFQFTGPVNFFAVGSLIGLGVVTGVSFYIYAEVLKRIPFLAATIGSNSSALFTLLWAWLFFQEAINSYIITGVVIMLVGILIINIPREKLLVWMGRKLTQD